MYEHNRDETRHPRVGREKGCAIRVVEGGPVEIVIGVGGHFAILTWLIDFLMYVIDGVILDVLM